MWISASMKNQELVTQTKTSPSATALRNQPRGQMVAVDRTIHNSRKCQGKKKSTHWWTHPYLNKGVLSPTLRRKPREAQTNTCLRRNQCDRQQRHLQLFRLSTASRCDLSVNLKNVTRKAEKEKHAREKTIHTRSVTERVVEKERVVPLPYLNIFVNNMLG